MPGESVEITVESFLGTSYSHIFKLYFLMISWRTDMVIYQYFLRLFSWIFCGCKASLFPPFWTVQQQDSQLSESSWNSLPHSPQGCAGKEVDPQSSAEKHQLPSSTWWICTQSIAPPAGAKDAAGRQGISASLETPCCQSSLQTPVKCTPLHRSGWLARAES